MINKQEQFFEAINNNMTIILATSAKGSVTMRMVSPVLYNNSVLIFTVKGSKKYCQLTENPNCCIEVDGIFAEAKAEFCGETMLPCNKLLRDVYSRKFPGAFIDGVEFGGRDAEFILLKPFRLSGWSFENDIPTPDSIPTIPYTIEIV